MRVGLISDIHGNLPALDAVAADLEREGVDEIVCLGDVAVGPQPAETLARVKELGCRVVMGNWDAAFLGSMPEPKDKIGERLVEIGEWWASYLSDADRDFMASFETELELELGSTPVLCFHGSPKSYDDWIFATTPDEELRPMLDRVEQTRPRRRPHARADDPPLPGDRDHQPGKRRPAFPRVVAEADPHLAVGGMGDPLRRGRAAEHGSAQDAVRRRRFPADEPVLGNAARRLVGKELVEGDRKENWMTGKADFTEEEWNLVREGPPTAGMIVLVSSKGGSFRETWALAKTFAEARKQHGDSELLDALVAHRPDTPRFSSPEEAEQQGLEQLRQAVALLREKATPEDVESYGNFVREVARRVAEAHKEESGQAVSAEEQEAIGKIESALA